MLVGHGDVEKLLPPALLPSARRDLDVLGPTVSCRTRPRRFRVRIHLHRVAIEWNPDSLACLCWPGSTIFSA